MIFTFFAWLYIFLLTGSLGLLLAAGWARVRRQPVPSLPVYQLSVLGLAVLTVVLGFYSLLAPIDGRLHLLLTAGVLVFVFCCPAPFRAVGQRLAGYPGRALLAGSLIGLIYLLGLLYWSTLPPTNDDTGFYHSQTIKWLEHFPVVPGLGNLHGRLAFNSSFLQWSALFSFTFLTGQPLFGLNGYLFLLLLAAFLPPLLRDPRQARPGHLVTALLFVLHFDFFPSWISSPTPDIGGMLLVCFIAHLALEQLEASPLAPAPFCVLTMLLLIFTCLTVKLSTLPVLGVAACLWYAAGRPLRPRPFLLPGLAMALVLLPWLARNVLQTGYFIYPLPLLDIWTVDWKVPLAAVIEEKNIIHSAAIRMGEDWRTVLALPLRAWFWDWFRGHSWFYRLFLVAAAVSPAAMLGYLAVSKAAYPALAMRKAQVLLWAAFYAGFLFWFSQAPSIRFGSAFLYLSWLLPLYWWLLPLIKRYRAWLQVLVLAGLTGFGLERLRDPVYLLRHQPQVLRQRLWLPAPQPRVALRPVPVHGGQVWVPAQSVLCWYESLPCTYLVPKNLAFRGKTLAQGFRIQRSGEW